MARKSRKATKQPLPVTYSPSLSSCPTGIYARLSVEGNGGDAKDSIQNQIAYLEEYVNRDRDDFRLVRVYVDNGATGTNFSREGWQSLIDDVKAGIIRCIVVKDFSRIGRNYIEVGNYLEKIFPFLGVRVVSVNDHFDSKRQSFESNMLMNSLANIVNDYYAKDISKKIVQARRTMQENGEYTSGVFPYGYRKSETHRRKMCVDPEAAHVVKKIFEWRVQGKSNAWIANSLNRLAIPSPGLYRYMNGKEAYRHSCNAKWNISHISGILKNPVYLGHLVQGKSHRSYFRENGKKQRMPKENWIITRNAHEPLATQEQFDIVNDMAERSGEKYRIQMKANAEVPHLDNPLRRKIYCGQCGRMMSRRSRVKGGVRRYYYFCDSKRTKMDAKCTRTLISEEALMESVKEVAVRHLQLAGDIADFWSRQKDERGRNSVSEYESITTCCPGEAGKDRLEREAALLKKKKQELYEDMKEGMLTREDFIHERECITKRQRQCEEELEKIAGAERPEEPGQQIIERLAGSYCAASELEWKDMPFELLDAIIQKIVVLSAGKVEMIFTYADIMEKWAMSAPLLPERMVSGNG